MWLPTVEWHYYLQKIKIAKLSNKTYSTIEAGMILDNHEMQAAEELYYCTTLI